MQSYGSKLLSVQVMEDFAALDAKSKAVHASSKTVISHYNILGESHKLTPKENTSMTNWRKEALKLASSNPDKVFINGSSSRKQVCLTFDDGPDGDITTKILDVLKSSEVKASFFFIGNKLNYFPEIVKRTDREGHLVLNHSFSHPQLSKKKPGEVERELALTEDRLYSLIGKKPAIMRPPYGDVMQDTIDTIYKKGYSIVLWSIDTLDWSLMEKNAIINNTADNVRPGDIILLHSNENKKPTLDALPYIIRKLKELGYEFVTLDEMLDVKGYK